MSRSSWAVAGSSARTTNWGGRSSTSGGSGSTKAGSANGPSASAGETSFGGESDGDGPLALSKSDDGCGCRIAGDDEARVLPALAGSLALALTWLRRRRSRSSLR